MAKIGFLRKVPGVNVTHQGMKPGVDGDSTVWFVRDHRADAIDM